MTTPPIYSLDDGEDDPLDPVVPDQAGAEIELSDSVMETLKEKGPLLDQARDVVTPPTPSQNRAGPATGPDTARTPPVPTLTRPDTVLGSLGTVAATARLSAQPDVDRKWAAEALGTRFDALANVVNSQGSVAPLPTQRPSLRFQ
jgi:hypothetical protein